MHTPAPTPIRPLSFAERFWAAAAGPETDDLPEPLRSVALVKHLLAVLERLDAEPRRAPGALVSMLRQAEIEGDLSYASPEQVRGEMLDTRSVVFSIGVVLFERLTGRHPFGAENNRPRRLERIRRGELGSGVNSFPTVAAGLRSVLVRAMSPFPEERWPELRQVRELLAQFCAQEAPPPRLPGTEAEGEQTKVVRMATDFGRELMQVVARHDTRPPPPMPRRLAIPTAGVASIGARRPSQATPQAGVVELRAVPPPPPVIEDSVVTTIVDPLAATQKLAADDLPPAPPPFAEPLASIDLRATSPRSRTMFVAIGGAAVGVIATVLFFALSSSSAPAPAPTAAAAAVTEPVPVAVTAPVAVAAPTPPPTSQPPSLPASQPPPVGNTEGLVSSAIRPCVTPPNRGARVFGLSLAFAHGKILKPYFDPSDDLTPAEHGCIKNAVHGLAPTGAPTDDAEYRVRVDASGVTLTPLGR